MNKSKYLSIILGNVCLKPTLKIDNTYLNKFIMELSDLF
jgi:hypothetical protein